MKIENVTERMGKYCFFALCEDCGSKTWLESEGTVNSLEEDGTQLTMKTIKEFITKCDYTIYPTCYECEKKLKLISFKTIPKNERKKVYKMTPEERKQWIINLRIFKELEKEEWVEGEEK